MNFKLTEEQQMWRKAVHGFCEQEVKPKAAELDASAEFNTEAFQKMGPLGLLGMDIPEEYGGAGVDSLSSAIALMELGMACGGTALSVVAHNGLGCSPISLFGTEEQKGNWLPTLAMGTGGLAALALTESGTGYVP